MESKDEQEDQTKIQSSILDGDGFSSISKILARESSAGQSSRIYYRSCEGVPFKWETQPGTPLHPQQDHIPPLSPPPSIQSLGLPLPNINNDDDDDELQGSSYVSKYSKIKGLKKMVKTMSKRDYVSKKVETLVKRRKKGKVIRSKLGKIMSNGELSGSVQGSSFSSYPSLVSYNSSSSHVFDSSRLPRDSMDGPFCCSPWNITAILNKGNSKIYYCRHHKTAFALKEDGSFLSRILSRYSADRDHQFSGPLNSNDIITHNGVPFKWEKQRGTSKSPPENEIIPPPSPPPAVQSLALPRPKIHDIEEHDSKESKWKLKTVLFRKKSDKKKMKDHDNEISFRYNNDEFVDGDFFRESGSVSSSSKLSVLSVLKMKRSLTSGGGGYVSCGPNWSINEILVFARKKLKVFQGT